MYRTTTGRSFFFVFSVLALSFAFADTPATNGDVVIKNALGGAKGLLGRP